jgi:hypothetical protein
VSDPSGNRYKDIRKELDRKRRVATLSDNLKAQRNGGGTPPPPPPKGTPEYAVAELKDVMKLPAAQSAVFKMASADLLATAIAEDIKSPDKELRMHAMDCSMKLITAVVKAQKAAPAAQFNLQVVTDGVSIAGLPGQARRQPEPRIRRADPSGGSGPESSDGSAE